MMPEFKIKIKKCYSETEFFKIMYMYINENRSPGEIGSVGLPYPLSKIEMSVSKESSDSRIGYYSIKTKIYFNIQHYVCPSVQFPHELKTSLSREKYQIDEYSERLHILKKMRGHFYHVSSLSTRVSGITAELYITQYAYPAHNECSKEVLPVLRSYIDVAELAVKACYNTHNLNYVRCDDLVLNITPLKKCTNLDKSYQIEQEKKL